MVDGHFSYNDNCVVSWYNRAIIGTGSSSRKHDKNLAVHAKDSEKDHASIKGKIDDTRDSITGAIMGAHNHTDEKVSQVFSTLSGLNNFMIASQTEQKVRFATLDDAQKKLYSSAEDIGKFAAEFSKIVTENKQLREQNESLIKENKSLLEEKNELQWRLGKNREIIKRHNEQAQPSAEREYDGPGI